MSVLFKALGDPTRYLIFSGILERKHCVRSMSKTLGITEAAVSQHMKVLREAGLVYGERFGRHVHYLPSQDALDFLAREAGKMAAKSRALCRDPNVCVCEFRKERGTK